MPAGIKSCAISRRDLLLGTMAVAGAAASCSAMADFPLARLVPEDGGSDPAIERRIDGLIAQMTLEEKVSLLSGVSQFSTAAIPRLGIPSLRMADGPNGLRTHDTSPATVFPAGVAMAATWNPLRAREVGQAIGEEAITKDYRIVLGPAMNIQRVPLGGRNFEYFSEDPCLTGSMAVGWTQGVRGTGRLTTPKHFAANNQEHERKRMNAQVSERALREIYLPAFHEVMTKADPGMVMVAYNKVNGTFATENSWLLRTVLKGEWAFNGAAMSDFGAVHSAATALNGGLDLEMPGPPLEFGPKLIQAVQNRQVSMETLDGAVRRMLRSIIRSGAMGGGVSNGHGAIDTPEHRAVSRAAAVEAITLLKNDGSVLPLQVSHLRTVAVIGPNADVRVIQGGGSSAVNPIRAVTALEGLRSALPESVKILFAGGADNNPYPPIADPRYFSSTKRRRDQGVTTRYWTKRDLSGEPAKTITSDGVFMRFRFGDEETDNPAGNLAVRSEGYFWPPRDGIYEFQLLDQDTSTLSLDGKPLITPAMTAYPPPLFDMLDWNARSAKVELKAGRPYLYGFEMLPANRKAPAYRIGIRLPSSSIAEAVAAAHDADVALVFVGSSDTSESETSDRTSLELFGEQNALVDAVTAVNPRTVVVLNNGGPLQLPWVDRVPAIVEAWFLGGESGHAIADVLLGHANPSGKLPMTFPKRLEDSPTYAFYPGGLNVEYGEDLFVGYRGYDHRDIEPLFPFGHGLSYTSFAFERPQVESSGADWKLTVDVTNTGQRAGAEVAQIYLGLPSNIGEPPRQLKRFAKVLLQPGERRTLTFVLGKQDLSYWDPSNQDWVMASGDYSVWVGGSSRDLRSAAKFYITESR